MGVQQVVAFGFRDGVHEILPIIGENAVRAFLIKPAYLLRPAQKNAAQN